MNILVYGYYGPDKRNAGDMLFTEAFKKLFPEYTFTFTDIITKANLDKVHAVFIGGGSMLDGVPSIEENAIDTLRSTPLFYIGVGADTDIHDQHNALMKIAKLICIRTPKDIDKVRAINPNVMAAPDLTYSLAGEVIGRHIAKTVLVVPNCHLLPRHSSKLWEKIRWDLFKNEISQALDILVERDYTVRFYGMDQSATMMDEWAAQEIINSMENRNSNYIIRNYYGSKSLMELFKSFEFVITSRYHGVMLSELAETPYISIAHHSKLMGAGYRAGCFLTMAEASKDRLLKGVETLNTQVKADIQPSDFAELRKRVKDILEPA
jgi:polysaccharide pyruvyl transferase WcaK-like protein